MILLDTDVFSLLLAGKESIVKRLSRAEDEIAITVITKVEVLRGRHDFLLKATDGSQLLSAQRLLNQIQNDLRSWNVVEFDTAVATEFDRLRQIRHLRKIGHADMLIASIALAHRAVLVTRNLRHFQQVAGLVLENWAD